MAKATRSNERSRNRRSPRTGGRKPARQIEGMKVIDGTDYDVMRRFMTDQGKILPLRLTGATAKQQRQIKRAVRRARVMGLLP